MLKPYIKIVTSVSNAAATKLLTEGIFIKMIKKEKEFTCICGYTCFGSQKFNSHRGHCEPYLQSVGKLEKVLEAHKRAAETGRKAIAQHTLERRQKALEQWICEKHVCEHCGKIMIEKYGSGRFCSRSCANARKVSDESKAKIKTSLAIFYAEKQKVSNIDKNSFVQDRTIKYHNTYLENPKFCSVCGQPLPYEKRFRKTCSDNCLQAAFVSAGRSSASSIGKRSKNEIAFCKLCEEYFGYENVLHNEPIFNGWDADVILLNYKVAILWNGPWHYRQVTKSHSLEQVQNRDYKKLREIVSCGYTPYIIKDLSKENNDKVLKEFNLLLEYLNIQRDEQLATLEATL